MQSLEAKQKYLRENIPVEEYQEFEAYLEKNVDNMDIEKWSGEFLVEIVSSYLKEREQVAEKLETSYYQYQQDGNEGSSTERVRRQEGKSKEELKISKAETSSMDVKPKSAMSLLDSVFEGNSNPPSHNNTPPTASKEVVKGKHSKSNDTPNFNFFQANEFWSSSGNNKPLPQKMSKSSADFTSFDFWSQSQPKSAQQFKTISFDPDPLNKTMPLDMGNFTTGNNTSQKKEVKTEKNVIPTFDELLKISSKPQEKAPSPYLKKNYPQQKEAIPAIKISKVIYDGEIVLKTQFKDAVKCFPSAQRKQFKSKDLFVQIEGHEIVNRTFLMPDYVMYTIKVQPLNITIKRNYQDFVRLRQSLSDFYPGIKLAYLQKSSWFSSTSIENIKRQKVMFQFFLNDLIKNKEIRNSRILEDFLTLPEHKKMKRKFEQFEKLEKPKCIEELCLLYGKVNVNLSENQRLYQENLRKYQDKMIGFLERHEKLSETLAQQYKAVSETLENLVVLSTSIIDQTHRFNERVFGLQLQQVEEVFKDIKKSYLQEQKVAVFNYQTITSTILPFLNYERNNTRQFDELINIQQSFFRSYLKRSEVEKIDSSMPYTSDKIKNTKISISQESKSILVLKYQAGYFSNQVCNEAKRIFETLSQKFKELWSTNALKKQEQTMKSLEFWKSLCSKLPNC